MHGIACARLLRLSNQIRKYNMHDNKKFSIRSGLPDSFA
ncbi:MAG: hypothetical protein JWP59_2200, partial [Massilia sp.]|nr:hypothetical protein [Massilia sp.]